MEISRSIARRERERRQDENFWIRTKHYHWLSGRSPGWIMAAVGLGTPAVKVKNIRAVHDEVQLFMPVLEICCVYTCLYKLPFRRMDVSIVHAINLPPYPGWCHFERHRASSMLHDPWQIQSSSDRTTQRKLNLKYWHPIARGFLFVKGSYD